MVRFVAPIKPPRSIVAWTDPFLIAILIIAGYVYLHGFGFSGLSMAVFIVLAVMLVMIPVEYYRSEGLHPVRPDISLALIWKRTAIKTLGLGLGVTLVLSAWCILPYYDLTSFKPLFVFVKCALPFLPALIIPWVFFTEWRLGPAEDHAWHFGMLALLRFNRINWAVIRQGLLGWLVKGFFFPLNLVAAVSSLDDLKSYEAVLPQSWPEIVAMLDAILYAMLILAIIPGYVLSARLLHTENKAIEASWFGWSVTMLCYGPVNLSAGRGWFHYRTDADIDPWITVFGTHGATSIMTGCGLIFCYAMHYWGESICCLRSSHLSNRGIITNGPFAICKHPVYVSKCIAWILVALPFVATPSWTANCRNTIIMLVFFSVYFMRAWVEERLLSHDATYVTYAHWMDQHSALRFLARVHPIFSYSWRYKHWVDSGILKI